MAEGVKKKINPDLRVEDDDETEIYELDPATGRPRAKSDASDSGPKLDMPSKQARKLTTVFNELVKLHPAGSVKAVIHGAMEKLDMQLATMHKQLAAIQPENDLQIKFKESWIAKNITRKEIFLAEVREALEQQDNDSNVASMTSSMRRAAIAAEEEEAKFELECRQMQLRHEQQRKQQEEQDALELRLAGVRARKQALLKFGSEGSLVSGGSRSQLPLPALRQPVAHWLESQRDEHVSQVAAPRDELGARMRSEHVSGLRREEPLQPHPSTSPALPQSEALFQHLLLAQARLPTFEGDQLDYPYFRRAFEVQVEQVTNDPSLQLFLLMQQLKGEPLLLTKACQLSLDPKEGMRRAKQLLDERYGNPVQHALEFVDKLSAWSPIKSSAELKSFSVQLQWGQEMKRTGLGLQELDSPVTMLKLVAKLPHKMQNSWQTKVVDIESSRAIAFDDLVDFVKRQEKAKNHPVFGRLESNQKQLASSQGAKTTTLATLAPGNIDEQKGMEPEETPATTVLTTIDASNAFKPPCLFCSGNHATSRCPTASAKPREERKEALRGLCFACLKPGHSARLCRARLKCSHCEGLHPTVLHEERAGVKSTSTAAPEHSDNNTAIKEKNLATSTAKGCIIGSLPARVWTASTESTQIVRAMLDSASTATFVTQTLANKLGAVITPVNLSVTTLDGERSIPVGLIQGMCISDPDRNSIMTIPTAYVVKELPSAPALSESDAAPWPHLAQVPFDWTCMDGPVEMLVGQNAPRAVTASQAVHAGDHEPYAVRTALGWALQGRMDASSGAQTSHTDEQTEQTLLTFGHDISHDLQRLFYHDFEDVYDFSTKGLSLEDRTWIEHVSNSTNRNELDSHFTVALPFKPDKVKQLKNNFSQAIQRLGTLKRKFALNPQFKADYVEFMSKMLSAGHVEPVLPEDTEGAQETDPAWPINYVPHHGVYHPRKPGKIRVVFNCASKFRGVALNDCLLSGPDLTNSIVGVLIRFRQYPVAFMADIEAMFYQVLVPEQQRNALRFLWWPGGVVDEDPAI